MCTKCATVKKLSGLWSPGGRARTETAAESHPGLTISSGKQTTTMTPPTLSKPSSVARKNKNEIQKKKRAFRNPYDDYTIYTKYIRPYTNNRPRQIHASAPPVYIHAIISMRILI